MKNSLLLSGLSLAVGVVPAIQMTQTQVGTTPLNINQSVQVSSTKISQPFGSVDLTPFNITYTTSNLVVMLFAGASISFTHPLLNNGNPVVKSIPIFLANNFLSTQTIYSNTEQAMAGTVTVASATIDIFYETDLTFAPAIMAKRIYATYTTNFLLPLLLGSFSLNITMPTLDYL